MRVVLPLLHLDNVVFTPLPQLRLRKALVDRGVCAPDDVTVLEYPRETSVQTILDEILALKPDIVGLSCYTWSFVAVERVSAALKALRPDMLIVWGGPHVSELPRRFFERFPQSVDLIITWYGEEPFAEVVKGHAHGMTPDEQAATIPGVWSAHYGEQAKIFPPLDSLGYAYEWMPKTVTDHMADRVFLLETFRNCPFSCSYCLWGQAGKTLDGLPEDRMYGEIMSLVDAGARILMFADAGLGLMRNPDRSSRDTRVFRRLADEGILARKGVNLRSYFFWQSMNDETLDVIKELIDQHVIGQLDIGIQTFNKAVIPDLQRPTNYEKFFTVVEKLHHRRIRFSLDLVLGMPGDTLDGFKDSLRKVISCRPDRCQTFPMSVLPGTAYDLRRSELGIKTVRGSMYDDAETVIETNTMRYADIQTALDLEAWMFLWYAEGLFLNSLTDLAIERNIDPLDQLDDLRTWSAKHAPHLAELANIYRRKLYDSRSEGRHQMEQRLMDTFADVYRELVAYFAGTNAVDTLRDELLTFPKFRETAQALDGVDGITAYVDGLLTRAGRSYAWQRDPVVGAIVRNKNHYAWQATREAMTA
jgi:anaerobic magnesium-protoporphyrin IX monomethyl ester cyclase